MHLPYSPPSHCATAIASIPELYAGGPKRLAWPHVFAPLLPTALVAYAGSPAPYIFGVHKANVGAALEHLGAGATGVIVVDIDVGVAHTTSRGDERAFALAENAGDADDALAARRHRGVPLPDGRQLR